MAARLPASSGGKGEAEREVEEGMNEMELGFFERIQEHGKVEQLQGRGKEGEGGGKENGGGNEERDDEK